MKRKDHNIEGDNEEEEEDDAANIVLSKKSDKVVTKAQMAKKLMKKKIQSNVKMTFDDSGEVVDEVTRQKLSEAGKQYEDDGDERLGGGIDITKAKEVLTAEDKFDKATERSRIKEKHKDEKRRKKEENRRLGKAARGLEEEGEESEEEGSEPDLSWLPDPDEVYGKEGEEEENVPEVEVKKGKRKVTVVTKVIPKKKARYEEEEDEGPVMDTGLSLGDDEDLAMQLLRR